MATLPPLTAVRCARLESRIARSRSAGTLEVSPTTRPGSSPRSSGGRPDTLTRSDSRIAPAAPWTGGGRPVTTRSSATSDAARPRSGSPGRTRTEARTRVPGSSPWTSTVVSSRTGRSALTTVPSAARHPSAAASTCHWSSVRRDPDVRPVRVCGSPVRTSSASRWARVPASGTNAPLVSGATRHRATPVVTTTSARTTSGARDRRHHDETPRPPATTAAATARCTPPSEAAPHTAAAMSSHAATPRRSPSQPVIRGRGA